MDNPFEFHEEDTIIACGGDIISYRCNIWIKYK